MAACKRQAPAEVHVTLRVDKNRVPRSRRSQRGGDLTFRITDNWNVSAAQKAQGRRRRPSGAIRAGWGQFNQDSVAVASGSSQEICHFRQAGSGAGALGMYCHDQQRGPWSVMQMDEAKAFPTDCAGPPLEGSISLQAVERSREGDDPERSKGVKVESWARGHVKTIVTRKRILIVSGGICLNFALCFNCLMDCGLV